MDDISMIVSGWVSCMLKACQRQLGWVSQLIHSDNGDQRLSLFSYSSRPEVHKTLLENGVGVGSWVDATKAEVGLQRGVVQVK